MTCRTPKLQRRVSHIRGPIGWRTCVADKNALKLSQSLIISDSNSARSVFPFTQSRAAVICSDWIRSTVLLNDTVHGSVNALNGPGGEPVRELRQIRESVSGVAVPDCTGDETAAGRRRASDAARRRRLVVPSAFVEPERAEQTIASLYRSKWSLQGFHEKILSGIFDLKKTGRTERTWLQDQSCFGVNLEVC